LELLTINNVERETKFRGCVRGGTSGSAQAIE